MCTSNCIHCGFASNLNESDALNTTEGMRVVDEVYDFGAKWLGISGGEPLLRRDLFEILGYAKRTGLNISLITNGILVEGRILDEIARNEVRVSISVEGAEESNDLIRGRGAYSKAVRAMDSLSKEGLLDCLVTTLVQVDPKRTNVREKDFKHVLDLAKTYNARWVVFHPFIPFNSRREHLNLAPTPEQYEWAWNKIYDLREERNGKPEINVYCPSFARVAKERELPKFEEWYRNVFLGRCFFAGRYLSIIENGDVVPCSFNDRHRLGNIKDRTLREIWDDLQTSEFYLKLGDRRNLKGKCGVCEYQSLCGGCRTRAELYTGNIFGSDPACAHIPLNYREASI